MSHVADCKAKFKCLDTIDDSAKRLGGTLHRGRKNARWFGHFVDDSTAWKSMFSPEEAAKIAAMSSTDRKKIINDKMSRCDHVISFPGASYDVGVVKENDGTFALRWDYYGAGGLVPFMGDQNGSRFKQAYAVEAAKRAAVRRGYSAREKVNSDGSIELELLVR